jgi:hypothetical protein
MKHKFTYKAESETYPNFSIPETEVQYSVETGDLSTLIEAFSFYLKACGYVFDGNLEIVDDEA